MTMQLRIYTLYINKNINNIRWCLIYTPPSLVVQGFSPNWIDRVNFELICCTYLGGLFSPHHGHMSLKKCVVQLPKYGNHKKEKSYTIRASTKSTIEK